LREDTPVSGLLALVRRDLLLALRQQADVYNTLLFFVVVVSLVPLGVGPEPALLRLIAPGVLWVAALLASMLSLHRLFAADHADGSLEQWVLTREPLPLLALGKIAAHWLVTGAPLTLLAAPLSLMFDLEREVALTLIAALLIGTPALSLIGAIGAALTLGLRGGGVLLSLLVLPLYAPVLIFGAGAAEAVAAGLSPQGHLLLLAALSLTAAVLAPWACAAALRISLE
jgi:heme exporter protein B